MSSKHYFYHIRHCLTVLAIICSLSVTAVDASVTLGLECSNIPGRTDKLCISKTESPYGPFDDVVIYHLNKKGNLILLSSSSGGVATFGGFDFTPKGTYMWESWSEEGHPSFAFYRTSDYLDKGEALLVLDEYYFSYFHQFDDDGVVAMAMQDGAYESCPERGKRPGFVIDKETGEKYCLKYWFLRSK